jgi:hypothetical protein
MKQVQKALAAANAEVAVLVVREENVATEEALAANAEAVDTETEEAAEAIETAALVAATETAALVVREENVAIEEALAAVSEEVAVVRETAALAASAENEATEVALVVAIETKAMAITTEVAVLLKPIETLALTKKTMLLAQTNQKKERINSLIL